DDGDVVAAAIKGPHRFCGRLEDDCVRVCAGSNRGNGCQGCAVKNSTSVAAAVGDIAKLAVRIKGYAVGAVKATDRAHQLAVRGVEHVHMIAASDVEAMRGRIGDQVVPEAIVGQLPVID